MTPRPNSCALRVGGNTKLQCAVPSHSDRAQTYLPPLCPHSGCGIASRQPPPHVGIGGSIAKRNCWPPEHGRPLRIWRERLAKGRAGSVVSPTYIVCKSMALSRSHRVELGEPLASRRNIWAAAARAGRRTRAKGEAVHLRISVMLNTLSFSTFFWKALLITRARTLVVAVGGGSIGRGARTDGTGRQPDGGIFGPC